MHWLARLALRLLGALAAGALALSVARQLSGHRSSSGVQPIEAALIALAIAFSRDVVDAVLDAAEQHAERREIAATLEALRDKLAPGSDVRELVPFKFIEGLRNSGCFRRVLSTQAFGEALTAVEDSAKSIATYASHCGDVSPADRREMSRNIERFLGASGMKP